MRLSHTNPRIALMLAIIVVFSGGQTAWSQMPIKNVTLPIPSIHGGPPIILKLNPQSAPPTVQQPLRKPFDFWGLRPPSASGLCAQVTSGYLALIDGGHHYRVFTFPQGFILPQGLAAGRQIHVVYKVLDNGLNQVKKIQVGDLPRFTNSGPPIPKVVAPTTVAVPKVVAPPVVVPRVR